MYGGQAEEWVDCPVCGARLWERRPPFRTGAMSFNCGQCGTLLRFSKQSQMRMVYILIVVLVFGPLAFLANHFFGALVGVIAAGCGAVVALGMLVWQGKAPQLEISE